MYSQLVTTWLAFVTFHAYNFLIFQYPSQVPPPQGYGAPPPAATYYQAPPQPYGMQAQPFAQGQNVMVQGGFDAGARFDGIAQPNVPVSTEIITTYNNYLGQEVVFLGLFVCVRSYSKSNELIFFQFFI